MEPLDNKFFESYKHLDKLCGEIFCCQNGVSEYISQMEKTPYGRNKVASWDNDYKTLKHLRWVRNQIAHDITGHLISTQKDLLLAEDFYNRIIKQEDPFAQLRKVQKNSSNVRNKHETRHLDNHYNAPHSFTEFKQSKSDKSGYTGAVFFIIFIFLLLLVFCFLAMK